MRRPPATGVCLCLVLVAAVVGAAAQAAEPLWPSYSVGPLRTTGLPLQTEADLTLVTEHLPEYGDSFKQLSVSITPETPYRLHVKIAPPGVARWEVPETVVARPGQQAGLSDATLAYSVTQPAAAPGQPFALKVVRRSNQQPLFDTTGHKFLFKDQYLELTTRVPRDANLYGTGEVSLPSGLQLPRDGTIITLWARDMPSANPYANLYGSHPFYMQLSADGTAHAVLLLNSNGMDIIPNAESFTFKSIGGLVELYILTGPTPEEVIQQYHELIGKPAMPPYWALGLHQSRWGWKDVDSLAQVVANYSAAGLPLEVVWSDIEYMPKFQTMEFDPVRYPVDRMRAFVDGLHANGQRWIPIQDAGVAAAEGYAAFEAGRAAGIFVRDHKGDPYIGQVWPGKAAFPDYMFNPATQGWLEQQLKAWHAAVPWDGLWLDMNEPASFCEGMVCEEDADNATSQHWLNVAPPADYNIDELIPMRTSCQMKCRRAKAATSSLDNPPYRIHNWASPLENTANVDWKTMSLTAQRHGGVREYDTHNLYGTAMAHDHYKAVAGITGKRPFMLTRSTFPGAGRYAAHWTGDNAANWASLHFSIAGIINSNFWGISMAGADICGFFDVADGETTDSKVRHSEANFQQLCNRWASAGAFYPFSRNHYTYYARHHEYYRWPDVTAAAKKAYGLRYRLLTYLYSALYLAHTRGGAVAKPLLFTDPTDVKARNATEQWLLGESVLVSPVIRPDTTTIRPYFTAGAWYNAWNSSRLDSSGQFIRHSVPMGDIAVHFRGGSIVPMQPYAQLTKNVRYAPLTLLVTLPGHASGTPGAPLPPYATEPACAAVHAAHAGQLVSCGVLFMDSADDAPLTRANSLEVWYTAVADANARSGRLAAGIKAGAAAAAGLGDSLRIGAIHLLGVAPDDEVAKQLKHQDAVFDVVNEAFVKASESNMRRGRTIYDAATYDVVSAAIDEAAQMDDAPPHATVNGAKLPAAWVKYSHTMRVIQITGLDLPVGAPLEVSWSLD